MAGGCAYPGSIPGLPANLKILLCHSNTIVMKNKSFIQGVLFPEFEQDVGQKSKKQSKKEGLKEINEKLLAQIQDLKKENSILQKKAEAFDAIISSKSLFTTTVVAKSFGWSALRLNKYLSDKKVQFRQGEVWVLYSKYANKDYTRICLYDYSMDSRGKPLTRAHTYWTGKGFAFIRELLKADNLLRD